MQINEQLLGRKARRAMARIEKHKEKKTGPKGINTFAVAATRAQKLTEPEQTKIMGLVNQCFDAMRKGTWRAPEWNTLADMLNTAAAFAYPGFNLLNDHIGKFHAAMDVMNAIAARLEVGKSWTCYAEEIKTMETAIEFFGYQIQFASRGEYFRAIDYGRNKVDKVQGWKEAA